MNYFKRLWTELTTKPAAQSRDEVVRFYQEMGFFAGTPAADVVAQYDQEFGNSPDPFKRWEDVYLLSLSRSRVWTGDPEADVCDGNEVYVETFMEWAKISEGAFSPEDITEQWEDEAGPVSVTFRLGGQTHAVHPKYRNDYIDLDVLKAINPLIAASGRQFAYASDVNFAVVLCLTAAERERIASVRAFPFA